MNANELEHLILQMRQIGNDTQACEVKESRNKISESIPDTLPPSPTATAASSSSAYPKRKDSRR